MNVNVDLIGQNGGQGDVAARLAANGKMDPGSNRPWLSPKDGKAYITVFKGGDAKKSENYTAIPHTNATLRRDEWKQLDEALIPISESRLNGVKDLIDKGLVYNLTNAMGTTVLEYQDISDALEAEATMDGITRTVGGRVEYTSNYMPIPIIHVDYEINARVLAASRSLGNPLDTTMAERAARKVAEKLESFLFTNTTYSYGGGNIYSYLNHPCRNQVTMTTAWDDSAKSARDILDEVLSLKQTAIDAHHHGPFMLYIPTAYETVLDEDYEDTATNSTNRTVRERILQIASIEGIKVVDTLTADNVLLVQMTNDVVRLVRGMGIQNIQWQTEGNFVNKFKVITIQVPQVRADQDCNSGVVQLAKSFA